MTGMMAKHSLLKVVQLVIISAIVNMADTSANIDDFVRFSIDMCIGESISKSNSLVHSFSVISVCVWEHSACQTYEGETPEYSMSSMCGSFSYKPSNRQVLRTLTITTIVQTAVNITFINLDLEVSAQCNRDQVVLHEYKGNTWTFLGKYCGKMIPFSIVSNTHIVRINLYISQYSTFFGMSYFLSPSGYVTTVNMEHFNINPPLASPLVHYGTIYKYHWRFLAKLPLYRLRIICWIKRAAKSNSGTLVFHDGPLPDATEILVHDFSNALNDSSQNTQLISTTFVADLTLNIPYMFTNQEDCPIRILIEEIHQMNCTIPGHPNCQQFTHNIYFGISMKWIYSGTIVYFIKFESKIGRYMTLQINYVEYEGPRSCLHAGFILYDDNYHIIKRFCAQDFMTFTQVFRQKNLFTGSSNVFYIMFYKNVPSERIQIIYTIQTTNCRGLTLYCPNDGKRATINIKEKGCSIINFIPSFTQEQYCKFKIKRILTGRLRVTMDTLVRGKRQNKLFTVHANSTVTEHTCREVITLERKVNTIVFKAERNKMTRREIEFSDSYVDIDYQSTCAYTYDRFIMHVTPVECWYEQLVNMTLLMLPQTKCGQMTVVDELGIYSFKVTYNEGTYFELYTELRGNPILCDMYCPSILTIDEFYADTSIRLIWNKYPDIAKWFTMTNSFGAQVTVSHCSTHCDRKLYFKAKTFHYLPKMTNGVEGCILSSTTGSYYWVQKVGTISWDDARSKCKEKGGDLATFSSIRIFNDFIQATTQTTCQDHLKALWMCTAVFIGLTGRVCYFFLILCCLVSYKCKENIDVYLPLVFKHI